MDELTADCWNSCVRRFSVRNVVFLLSLVFSYWLPLLILFYRLVWISLSLSLFSFTSQSNSSSHKDTSSYTQPHYNRHSAVIAAHFSAISSVACVPSSNTDAVGCFFLSLSLLSFPPINVMLAHSHCPTHYTTHYSSRNLQLWLTARSHRGLMMRKLAFLSLWKQRLTFSLLVSYSCCRKTSGDSPFLFILALSHSLPQRVARFHFCRSQFVFKLRNETTNIKASFLKLPFSSDTTWPLAF